jgi:hypothetical protein
MVGLLKLSEQTTTILGTKRDPPFQFQAPTSSALLAFTDQLMRYLATYWEDVFGQPVQIQQLRRVLDPPIPIRTVLEFSRFNITHGFEEIEGNLTRLVTHLKARLQELSGALQLHFFPPRETPLAKVNSQPSAGQTVLSLHPLLDSGQKFPTIYADPPWPYDNEASRGAAPNHYPVMSLEDICREPVQQLAEENAHLHLWTTNGFLREAFRVMGD